MAYIKLVMYKWLVYKLATSLIVFVLYYVCYFIFKVNFYLIIKLSPFSSIIF